MPTALSKHRANSFQQQRGLCFYCCQPMWLKSQNDFATQYSISCKQSKKYQCTAEHLIARQDGGLNHQKNIVAACKFCNQTRHRASHPKSPSDYFRHVQSRINKGKWHSLKKFKATSACTRTVA